MSQIKPKGSNQTKQTEHDRIDQRRPNEPN